MKKILCVIALLALTSYSFGQKNKELSMNEETGLIEAVYFHDNGQISQKGTFNLERKLHGEWISFNEQGDKIAQGSYDNGLRTGTWLFWQGETIKEVKYENNTVASVNGVKSKDRLVKNDH
ncbi:MAG: nicotinic acid mononucleotide adenyltransferase [Muriicola sp.]|nr:nicotinic acid mononucleotide adenyltransferase [Muriicola sp.]NNK09872.1 nicotinic acid mononucleotide adenyltransferase [Flavobacteriaceae bacterium]